VHQHFGGKNTDENVGQLKVTHWQNDNTSYENSVPHVSSPKKKILYMNKNLPEPDTITDRPNSE
jgi:hypothetical protein